MTLTTNPVDLIGSLVKDLMDPAITWEREKELINALQVIISQKSGEVGFENGPASEHDLQASSGLAISTKEAARCLLDYARTGQFVRGFYQAIQEARDLYPGETIKILYAGCGPYAPFFTLIAPLFAPGEIQFSLLEINGNSLNMAKGLIGELGLGAFVTDYYEEDATTFQLPGAKDYHLLFSETMDAALNRECLVPILLNLLPQLREGIFVVPRNVVLEAFLFTEASVAEGDATLRDRLIQATGHNVGVALDMNEAISAHLKKQPPLGKKLGKLRRPVPDLKGFKYFVLFTEVEVWKGVYLYSGESDITNVMVRWLRPQKPYRFVEFVYCLEKSPQLRYTFYCN